VRTVIKGISSRLSLGLFLYPTLVLFVAAGVTPLGYAIYTSLHKMNLMKPALGMPFVGLANYVWVFTNSGAIDALLRTLQFVALSVVISFILGAAMALLLNGRFRGASLVRAILILPMVVTPVVTGMMFKFMLEPTFGPVSYYIGRLGLGPIDWLGNPNIAIYSVVAADVWQWTPLVFLILLAALQTLPQDVYEAASLDGASSRQLMRYLTLPLLRTPIVLALLLRLMDAMRAFDQIYSMTRGGPGSATEVASVFLYNSGFRVFRMGRTAAFAVLIFAVILVASYIFVKATAKRAAREGTA